MHSVYKSIRKKYFVIVCLLIPVYSWVMKFKQQITPSKKEDVCRTKNSS